MDLLRASANGDLTAVKKNVADGADVNTADSSGRTALIEAAWAGHADVVRYLVEKGAKVALADNAGFTPLMRACEEGNAQVVTYLVSKGSNVNARGKVRGTTPLMLAAEQGHIKVIDILLAAGAKINDVDQYEETALARAYYMEQTKAAQHLEAKGGRGKPERSSLSHYSSKDRNSRPSTKAALPQWSAAAADAGLDEDDPIPEEASTEDLLEE
jgi:ankyrin repeat protein